MNSSPQTATPTERRRRFARFLPLPLCAIAVAITALAQPAAANADTPPNYSLSSNTIKDAIGVHSTLAPWNTTTVHYNCKDYNKITTKDGVVGAFPYGAYSTTTGWTNTSGSSVTASSPDGSKEYGNIDVLFTNWSLTDSADIGANFQCSTVGILNPGINKMDVQAPTDIATNSATVHVQAHMYSDFLHDAQTLEPSDYFVEYGSAPGDYSQTSPVQVSARSKDGVADLTTKLTGLDPNTNYHYRFVLKPKYNTNTPKGVAVEEQDYSNPNNTFTTSTGPQSSFSKIGAPDDQLLEVNGGSDQDGASVDTWTRTNTATGAPQANQLWKYTLTTTNGFGQLVSVNSGKCLQANPQAGSIGQASCVAGLDQQQWRIVKNTAGGSAIQVYFYSSTGKYPAGAYNLATTKDPAAAGNGTTLTLKPSTQMDATTTWQMNDEAK